MKKVLVLGAGLVSRPLVRYLLDQPDFKVTVASRTVSKAEALIAGHPDGTALPLLAKDTAKLDELVSQHDLAISLLPAPLHPVVAEMCIKHKKHMVTTSYVSPKMKTLDGPARDRRRHAAQRDRRRPRHRPHVRHAHHPRRREARRKGRQLPLVLRRAAGPGGQRQPVGLQVLLEPAGRLHRRQEFRLLPPGRQEDRRARPRALHPRRAGQRRGRRQARGLPQPRFAWLPRSLRPSGHRDHVPRHVPLPRLVRLSEEDRRSEPARRDARSPIPRG